MKEQKKMSTSSLFSLQFCILFVSGFMLSETYQLKSHYPTTNKIHSLTPIQIRQQDICLYGKGLGSKGSDETFCCQECGVEHIKWVGKCSSCGTWNSVKAFRPTKQIFNPTGSAARRPIPTSWVSSTSSQPSSSFTSSSPMSDQTSSYSTSAGPYSSPPSSSSYNSYSSSAYPAGASTMRPMEGIEVDEAASRIPLFSDELNRVFGGGLVKGSVVLCAGEPGIGKSTLFMQIASYIASRTSNADIRAPVVYVSGEENSDQIVSRARRLRLPTANILLHCEIEVEQIIANIIDLSSKPAVVVVDSVQTMYTSTCTGSSGSVTQIRESTARFIQLAKTYDITVILLGHVTKSGDVAGPRVLEHMVDTVLFMESSESEDHRIVRTMKNRFGSTHEIGIFSMTPQGLVDVPNPSELFMSSAVISPGTEGCAAAVVMEGSRPMIAEIQSLVGDFSSGAGKVNPRRTADGFPLQRLLLICAVIEKRIKLPLFNRDVFLNVVGGLRVSEPSSDLAVAVSIISSMLGVSVLPAVAFIGEIGLSGEVRGGSKIDLRVVEARQMGFTTIIVPQLSKFGSRRTKGNSVSGDSGSTSGSGIVACASLSQALEHAFGGDGFQAILAKRFKKTKSTSRSLNNDEGDRSASGRSGGGRKLYAPGEEAWMNEPSDMIPFVDDDEVV